MKLKKNQIIEAEILDVNMMGLGVAKVDGAVVFVQNGVTGDLCKLRIIKCAKNYYVARVEEFLISSTHRITPDCKHYKRCGGCNFQHISYDLEKIIKKKYVENCLRKANVTNFFVKEPISCNKTLSYRNKAQFPVGEDSDGNLYVGFYSNRSHDICRVTSCAIQDKEFGPTANFVCEFFSGKRVAAYNEETGTGLLRHIYLRKGSATGDVMLCLVVSSDTIEFENEFSDTVTRIFPQIKSIVININPEKTNVILGKQSRVIFGIDKISDILCDTTLLLSHKSFYQVNHDATEILYRKAFEMARLEEHDMIIDLFCGIGSIALTASEKLPVIGVEIIPEAVKNAQENANLNGRKNVRFLCGDANTAFEFIRKDEGKNPLVIVDPPRKGLSSDLILSIAKNNIKKILYISCGPDTLARDLKLFQQNGYEIGPIQPVDLFPRTGHIETVVLLSREKADDYVRISVHTKDLKTSVN